MTFDITPACLFLERSYEVTLHNQIHGALRAQQKYLVLSVIFFSFQESHLLGFLVSLMDGQKTENF